MTTVALDYATWIGGYDITADLNRFSLDISLDASEATHFGAKGMVRNGGLAVAEASLDGWFQAGVGLVDPTLWAAMATTMQAVTHSTSGTEGDIAYFYPSKQFNYKLFGGIGETVPFSLGIKGARRAGGVANPSPIRGRVAKAKGNVSATGATGTAQQLGAVPFTQFVYAALHVFSAGTTITVAVESDDNAGFTSPTTRGTIGPITAAGGSLMARVAGAITDTYWRFNVTAVTGTFSIAGAIGIG